MKTETIKLIVTPGSSVSGVFGIYKDRIKIKLNSAPEKGKANKELVSFISNRTGIPRKNIKIISGDKSHLKDISLRYDNDFDLTSKILKG
jgi:uncharacterized protein